MAKKHEKIRVEIPIEGSLGILALGAVGIKMWREKRAEALLKLGKETQNEE